MAATLHTDRWMEIALFWFHPDTLEEQTREVIDRLKPLWETIDGDQGLVFDISGMRYDCVTEWTGNPGQTLPLPPQGPFAEWLDKSYENVKQLFEMLRHKAADAGLSNFKIAVMGMGVGDVEDHDGTIYQFACPFFSRHREIFANIIGLPPHIDLTAKMNADDYPYAAQPGGATQDQTFGPLFAKQFGSFCRYFNLDGYVLRDGAVTTMVYRRWSHYGGHLPGGQNTSRIWTDKVIEMINGMKNAAPATKIIGYSSAASSVGEWRVGAFDIERCVAESALDAWIDQSWAGAWQDFWSWDHLGWTFQLANILSRRAFIEAGNRKRKGRPPCRHYVLTDIWCGWEPWDTIHNVPQKLRWGIWAFHHAAVRTPDGLVTPDGTYIAWVSARAGDLVSDDDVTFLRTELDAAVASAAAMDDVHGPSMTLNRSLLDWLSENHEEWNASEWVDDHTAWLMKWGVPCLSATRGEWLDKVETEGLIAQAPGHVGAVEQAERERRLDTGEPVVMTGRADLIDPAHLHRAGVRAEGELAPRRFYKAWTDETQTTLVPRVKISLDVTQPVAADEDVTVGCMAESGPLLVRKGQTAWWQPGDWHDPGMPLLKICQVGSYHPIRQCAAWMQDMAKAAGFIHIDPLDEPHTAAIHAWHSGGKLHILLGNLETGNTGDARLPRHVKLFVPATIGGGTALRDIASDEMVEPDGQDGSFVSYSLVIPPEGSRVLKES